MVHSAVMVSYTWTNRADSTFEQAPPPTYIFMPMITAVARHVGMGRGGS